MVEAGKVVGVLAAVLLLMATIAWVKLIRGPLMHQPGALTDMDPVQGEFASELLFWAVGLSSAAMCLAVAGWIFR